MMADFGHTIGMTLYFESGLEDSVLRLADLGFTAVEVLHSQMTPQLIDVNAGPRHAEFAGEVVRESGLMVSTLNCAGHPGFDPIRAPDSSMDLLAEQIRWAEAMGSPRILIWDGIVDRGVDAASAPSRLAMVIDGARERSRVAAPPVISVELHPFTFALERDLLLETATSLGAIEAGICLDLCHFAVALGPEFTDALVPSVRAAINYVHYSDSDSATSELHMPPGRGSLNLERIASFLSGSGLSVAWDLFCWPAPLRAISAGKEAYERFVNTVASPAS